MNCVRCLRPVPAGARWCSFCGEPIPAVAGETQPLPDPDPEVEDVESQAYAPSPAPRQLPTSGAAVAALVFAIAGLVGPFPLIGSFFALAFAARARREASYGVADGYQLSRAARIIAWTGIVLYVVAAAATAGAAYWFVHQGHRITFG